MLYLAEWLSQFQTGFNVFRYLTLRAIMGVLTALAIALLLRLFDVTGAATLSDDAPAPPDALQSIEVHKNGRSY